MIKICHIADLHLGFRQYGFAEREADFYKAAGEAFRTAIEAGVQAIVIAGDIFDSSKPPALAVWVLQELVAEARKKGVRVLAIDGNHDSCGGVWLQICGIESLHRCVVTLEHDGVAMNIGGVNACRPQTFYETIDHVLETKRRGCDLHMLVIHQAVSELCDFATQDYSAQQISSHVKPLGVQYVAMGDIHVYRETVINGVRFAYPGSTEVNAVDEPTDKCGILVMYDGKEITTGLLPIKTRPFITCTLESDADVDALLVKAADKPVIVGWYAADKRSIAERAEKLLHEHGCMYRIMPYSGDSQKAQATFERSGAMLKLKDAVTAYFEENSDEFQLVFQLLGSPDDTKRIVKEYMTSKGLQ